MKCLAKDISSLGDMKCWWDMSVIGCCECQIFSHNHVERCLGADLWVFLFEDRALMGYLM
jgi:hypothetical protein